MNLRRVLETKKSRTDVYTVPMDANVSDFIRAVVKKGVGAMIVMEGDKVGGIITERDILRHCERKTDFDHTPVGLIMTRDVITAQAEDDIVKAMDLMIKGKMRHLPVMDGTKVAGMITVRDILGALRSATPAELDEVSRELKVQPTLSWGATIY